MKKELFYIMTMTKMISTKVIHHAVPMKKKFTNQFKLVVGRVKFGQ
uniref:Uncharacterized protein n=1 Tax=Romanomermis culicivorax TaxID=13658 RepID=A0A915I5Z1_ROMCU